MGKYNLTALRVRQTALRQVASDKIDSMPRWIDVVGEIPPAQVVVRQQPIQHEYVRQRVRLVKNKPEVYHERINQKRTNPNKKPSKMFQPAEIKYEEDQLRKEFFRDHPWELARPRIVLETTGKDFEKYNWNQLQQPGKKLSGERCAFYLPPLLVCLEIAQTLTFLIFFSTAWCNGNYISSTLCRT